MADEWDKYAVDTASSSDEWSQYEVAQASPEAKGNALGGALGLGAAGAVGYGLYKSKIPQNIAKGVGSVAKGVSNLPKVVNVDKGAAFANEVRSEFVKAHSRAVNKFANRLDTYAAKNPDAKVSLGNVVEDLNANWNDLPNEVKGVVKRTPYLRDMVLSKEAVTDVSLKQSQEIINYINTKVPKNIRANNLDLLDTVNNIKGAQLESFPEMKGARASYKQFIEPYNQVKSFFKFNRVLNGIKTKFGGAEGQVAVEKILPKKTLAKMRNYRTAAKMAELPGDIPLVGRMFRSMGGMMMAAPQVLQAVQAVQQNPGNPGGQFFQMATGENPEQSFEEWRKRQTL